MILLVGIVLFSQKDNLNGNLTGYAVKSTNLKEVDAFTVIKPDERVFQEFSSLNIPSISALEDIVTKALSFTAINWNKVYPQIKTAMNAI